ncbi:histidine kinase [Scytonema hofmannii PCC 7110]|uniref:histidine kinase n=1 Tax=Scytonema hofmannii PCC 7110 TaxID=128403 RepID=A0A139WWN7_9CYAN|nr:ATP-binding sensor histidine kinase [Scytonema hofmannii]KYC36823.1 histidine kinase [Scytonema hofmannii PCC 7110]
MSAKIDGTVRLAGYQIIEQLYSGSRTQVYRAVRECNRLPVVIKLLKREYPTFSELLQFRNQYAIAKNLDIPGIIKPYSLEIYHNGYALVMEDFGGISLWQFTQGKILTLQEFLPVALQLLDTLHQLHQQRVIHKDIKSANILIHPDTRQIKLIDFSIASLLPRETQEIQSPNGLEGTLAYLSPEQTGRMNRCIDYRSDFYSLGVTFFELLSGQLPFESHDPMELVHCHIAKQPPLVCNFNPDLPLILGEIVRKLMAKNAEDRYQSALGLKHDLVTCLEQWRETGKHTWFELGQRDMSDRFIIPEKLYGREQEVQTLLEAFGRVANGACELMLVAGFSGIGKTSVVNEVHKPIARWNGYFIKGKFDQYNRNIPLNAFVQAFRDLMGQLLSESDTQLKHWKTRILDTLGENARVIIDVIPEMEKIVGEQPAVPELSGNAAQNRFNLLFEKFIQVFTTQAHPLVVFIDDLQWADSASLKLLQLLMNDTEYLLILGAYRDNEVSPAHSLMQTLDDIEKVHAMVNTITLAPLDQSSVNQLITDTLSCDVKLALPLTELVMTKTKGNPFFTTQFLRALHENGLITFNGSGNYWECNIAQVRQLALSDDVVEFMALQLQKLPVATQTVLKLAACISNQFDLTTLAIASEQSEIETATNLWKALQEGLILPTSEVYKFYQDSSFVIRHSSTVNNQAQTQMTNDQRQITVFYKFLHDRVQQAAYSLIAEEQRPSIHLNMGQLLLNNTSDIEQDNKLFDIINHLNRGSRLVVQPTEREQIAQLNGLAAKKARSATAYESAMNYATTGITLLTPDCWQSQYELALMLHELAAENAFLARDFEQMEHWAQTVLQQAKTPLDQVKIYEIKIQTYVSQHQPLNAIALGKKVLSQFGIQLPDRPTQEHIQQEFQHTADRFAGRSIEELLNLPSMTASEPLAAMKIAACTAPAIYFAAPSLYPLVILSQVNASIQHGNAPLSTFFYASYGLLLNGILEDMEAADRAGKLALEVMEKLNAKEVESKTRFLLGGYVLHGTNHLRKSLQFLRQSYQLGLETGDIKFAGHAAFHICQYSYFSSQELLTLEQDIQAYSQMLKNLKQIMAFNYCQLFRQVALNLLGNAKNPRLLVGDVYDEAQALPQLLAANDMMALHFFYLHKLILGYLFGDTAQSLSDIATRSRQYLAAGAGYITVPIFYFYDSLATLTGDFSEDSELGDPLQRVAENQAKLQKWAHHAPMNHLHKWHLVEAEKHRVLGNKVEASDQYDRAISLAKEHGYLNEDALAKELAARFYLEWGKERIAQDYMIEAYYGYICWGAKAKVTDLETRYPQLLAPILGQTRSILSINETVFPLGTVTSTSSSATISDSLDLATILKASQTLSSEIEVKKLLSSWLSIVIENAGAEKCVLMLFRDDSLRETKDEQLLIKGLMTVGSEPVVLQRLPIEESQDIPLRLIYKVKHERQTAVLIDATTDLTLANDPYIMRQQPKSILCSPILHQGKLLGVLYLENNIVRGAFTSDRVKLLNLFCTQAAISLENARLYERSQNYAQKLEQSLNELSASNSRFHHLVDNVPGVVYQFRMSDDGILSVSYISADCYKLLEITPEQAISNAEFLKDMVHPDDIGSYHQSATDAIQTQSPWCWTGRIVTPSGILKWIHGESRIEQLGDGSVVWDGLLLDISAPKKAELALQQKSQDLQQAFLDLQQAQLQIIQSEKMSALGNLVAGVAHEMNNPLGFIAASLLQAKPTFADVVEHLKLYQETFQNKSDEIIKHAQEIDLEYSLEDLPKMLESMTMACDRLKNISTSLRTFSRADRDYKVPFNIHQGIDSTILILKHRLKANEQRPAIEVTTEYDNLPQVECFPGQLNQVFMNILANAIDALEESNNGCCFDKIKANTNRIKITTSVKDNQVKISITDNGIGMSESVKQKIFDHLFTTKAVGKGTGLGLAIARQIVEETHGGSLQCYSSPGQGTEFAILIPVR